MMNSNAAKPSTCCEDCPFESDDSAGANEIQSLDSIRENERPTADFRVMMGNSESIESVMTENAKTVEEKRAVLGRWERAKALLEGMIQRLNESIEKSERIQRQIDEAKDKALALQLRSGGPYRVF